VLNHKWRENWRSARKAFSVGGIFGAKERRWCKIILPYWMFLFCPVLFLLLLTATYVAQKCQRNALLPFHGNNTYTNAPRYVIRILPILLCTSLASFTITIQRVDGNSQRRYFTCYNWFSPRVISYSVNNLNPLQPSKGWSYFISRQNQITGEKPLLLNS
jgi:hypothetical protein